MQKFYLELNERKRYTHTQHGNREPSQLNERKQTRKKTDLISHDTSAVRAQYLSMVIKFGITKLFNEIFRLLFVHFNLTEDSTRAKAKE